MKDKTLQAIIKLKDEVTRPLRDIKKSMSDFGKHVDKTKKELSDFNNGMKTVGKSAIVAGGAITAGLGAAFASCTKEAIEFESAFTGVKKTIDETVNTSYSDLNKGLIDMSTRIPKSANELAGIAEIAGQLGISADNVLGFTETMARLADSTNIVGEEGALALAKFMNVMGTSQGDVDKLGAVIVQLGNNMATTEADILNMATRLSDLGILADFSESQVMGWASAMSSVGIEAEMGGTAMKKLVTEIEMATLGGGDALQQFSDIAGMSADQYKKAFEKDASGATLAFLKGLKKVKDEGGSISETLFDLDIKEVRLRETIIKLASANEDVAKALGMANDEWGKHEALIKESNTRYGTTESSIKLMKNQITAAKIEIGNAFLPVVRDATEFIGKMAKAFNELSPEARKTIVNVALVTLAIGGILLIAGSAIMFIAGLTSAIGILGGVAAIVGGIIAFFTSPFFLLILVIGLVIANVIYFKKKWYDNFNGVRNKTKSIIDAITEWWIPFAKMISNPIQGAITITKKVVESVASKSKSKGKRKAFGGRVMGNDIPYKLHSGERVLSRTEADNYEKGSGFGGAININIDKMTVREDADINRIASELASRLKRERLAFAGGKY